MKKVPLKAYLIIQDEEDPAVVSLILSAGSQQAQEILSSMAWGREENVNGLRYYHENTVYPHTIGADGEGNVELAMTINHKPWSEVPMITRLLS